MRGLYWSEGRGSFGVWGRLLRGRGLVSLWWLGFTLRCVQVLDPVVIVVHGFGFRSWGERIQSLSFIDSFRLALLGSQLPLGGEKTERIIAEVFARSPGDEFKFVFRLWFLSYGS